MTVVKHTIVITLTKVIYSKLFKDLFETMNKFLDIGSFTEHSRKLGEVWIMFSECPYVRSTENTWSQYLRYEILKLSLYHTLIVVLKGLDFNSYENL